MCIYSSTGKTQARAAQQLGNTKPTGTAHCYKAGVNNMTLNTHLLGKNRRNRNMMLSFPT